MLKPSRLVIDSDRPFASDAFDLEVFAKALTGLVKKNSNSIVVSLDAPWGQGKTTFLEMWRLYLRNEGITSLYFNAWENDFSPDPLIALIGELGSEMESLGLGKANKLGKHVTKLKKVGVKVAQRSLPVAVKLATMGMLDLSDATESVVGDLGEKFAEEEIARYASSKNSIAAFRKEISNFVTALNSSAGNSFPLVVVIDELDRCRPDYAIKVLETIKHLFAVEGVFFVVATDASQLSNAIRHIYGLDTSSDDYLRRFFDLSLLLPEPSPKKFIPNLIERHALSEFFARRNHSELRYDRDQTVWTFEALFEATNCSLRDQQKCFTLLSLAIDSVQEDQYLHPLLLCVLIVLRVKQHSLYRKYVAGHVNGEEVIDVLKKTKAGRRLFESQRGYGDVVRAHLVFGTRDRQEREDLIAAIRSKAQDEAVAKNDRQSAENIVRIMDSYEFRNVAGAMRYTLPRIELFARTLDQYE